MSRSAEYGEKIVTVGLPPLLVLLGFALTELAPATLAHVLTVLTAWTCAALPLAVLIGHCSLGEE